MAKKHNIVRTMALAFILTSVIPLILAYAMIFLVEAETVSDKLKQITPFIIWIIISSFAGYFIIRRIGLSITALTRQAKAVTSGDISKKIQVPSAQATEVDELVGSFDKITKDLELKIEQLQASKRLLRDLFHNIGDAMTSPAGLAA